jgi:hypothetical protein
MVTAADGGDAGAAAAVALGDLNQWKPWNLLVPNRWTTSFMGWAGFCPKTI